MPEMRGAADYDLGGVVRVRLLDAGDAERRVVGRQLGLPPLDPVGEPDIEVQFVDLLPIHGILRPIELAGAAYDDDQFIVVRGKRKTPIRAVLPLDTVGDACRILCERGLLAVPYLVAIINLTALANGYVPLHGSAFVYCGRGTLVTGWARGGKTETLLAFAEHGAAYVGDEWVYIAADGSRMFGIPEPLTVWNWHLGQLPTLRSLVPAAQRARMAGLAAADRALGAIARHATGGGVGARTVRRLHGLAGNQLSLPVPPARVFGPERLVREAPIDTIVFVVSAAAPGINVVEVDPGPVAQRMAASVAYEGLGLWTLYLAHRFAFPSRRNELIEGAPRLGAERLQAALAGKPALEVQHPYPFSFAALYDALEPRLG